MAREYNGTNQAYEITALPVTAYPFTLATWLYLPTGGDFYCAPSMHAAGSSVYQYIGADGTAAYTGRRTGGGSEFNASSSAGPTLDAWNHIAGQFVGDTEAHVFLNGGNKGDDTNNVPFDGSINTTSLGRLRTTGDNFWGTGRLAETAVWDVVLTDAEIALLAKGFSPRLFRPDHLKAYWPQIGRYSPELDLGPKGAFPLAATGTPTTQPHTRIFYLYPPTQRKLVTVAPITREQEGFRWRADDGSESAASWLASQDTSISRAKQTNTRLRILTNITSDPPSEALKLQWRKSGDPDTEWRDVT